MVVGVEEALREASELLWYLVTLAVAATPYVIYDVLKDSVIGLLARYARKMLFAAISALGSCCCGCLRRFSWF